MLLADSSDSLGLSPFLFAVPIVVCLIDSHKQSLSYIKEQHGKVGREKEKAVMSSNDGPKRSIHAVSGEPLIE
jgi:hypothetical protein